MGEDLDTENFVPHVSFWLTTENGRLTTHL